jgi:hypothetical protein
MDQSIKIAALLFLHVGRETSKKEEQEIAAWRARSTEYEMLYWQLSNINYVINIIQSNNCTVLKESVLFVSERLLCLC